MINTYSVCSYRFPEPVPGAICPECGGKITTSTWATVVPGKAVATGTKVLAYWYAEYARDWYEDALREARSGPLGDRHARRREIVFAVCCVESYLYEWAFQRVRAMKSAAGLEADLLRHLPVPVLLKQINPRWVSITESLHRDGLLPKLPEVQSGGHGVEWNRLLDYRNALVHASISRPVFGSGPVPDPPDTNNELASLAPGWAVGVVAERIRRLHEAADTPPPAWLIEPGVA